MKKPIHLFILIFLSAVISGGIGCSALKKKHTDIHPLSITIPVSAKSTDSGIAGSGGVVVADDTRKELGSGEKFQPQMQQQQLFKKKLIGRTLPDAVDAVASTRAAVENKLKTVATQPVDTIKKNASLGVFCPPRMELYETRLITVKLDVNKTQAQVKEDVVRIEKISNDWKSESDSSSVIAISLDVFDSVKVSLKYDTADFIISPAVGNTGKYTKVDVKNGNLWQWNIEAISKNKRSSEITLVVGAHTPEDLDLPPIPSHVIPIIIYFDFGDAIRGWVRYLGENPQYTIPSVLVPIIAVIYKRRKKGKAQGKDKT